jgi:integrase
MSMRRLCRHPQDRHASPDAALHPRVSKDAIWGSQHRLCCPAETALYRTDYLDVEFEDLEEYGPELRTASEHPIAGETWNRKLAAIHDFYLSHMRNGRLRPGDGPFADPDACRQLRSRAVGAQAVRYLLLPQLRYFVQVGIRGYRPDGTIDTAFRGGYPGRDACMVNMLATTGLRRNEMRSLTTVELDLGAQPRQGCRLMVGVPAKGGRRGDVIAPRRTLEDVRAYVDGDHDVIVSVANSTGSLRKQEPTNDRRRIARRTAPDRRGLGQGPEPRIRKSRVSYVRRRTATRLQAGRRPVGTSGAVRRRGRLHDFRQPRQPDTRERQPSHLVLPNERRGDRHATKVTPHLMRHTFGMHLMWTLMHDLIERDNRLTRLLREHDEPGLRAYGQSVMWPVQVVQELMRHRSLRTTWLYLSPRRTRPQRDRISR